MMSRLVPALSRFKFLLRDKWKSAERIEQVSVPILFLSGEVDSLVPPKMMETLYKKAIRSKGSFVRVENGDHNDTWQQEKYMNHIVQFVSDVLYPIKSG